MVPAVNQYMSLYIDYLQDPAFHRYMSLEPLSTQLCAELPRIFGAIIPHFLNPITNVYFIVWRYYITAYTTHTVVDDIKVNLVFNI